MQSNETNLEIQNAFEETVERKEAILKRLKEIGVSPENVDEIESMLTIMRNSICIWQMKKDQERTEITLESFSNNMSKIIA